MLAGSGVEVFWTVFPRAERSSINRPLLVGGSGPIQDVHRPIQILLGQFGLCIVVGKGISGLKRSLDSSEPEKTGLRS